jgi:hypothetical protein
VFYVGKGAARRAWDLSPTRRTQHHVNIIRKYGAKNILVTVTHHPDEVSAFDHERALIASYRAMGVQLINLTDGGEGATGRPYSAEQAAGFALGRRSWAERGLSEETIATIHAGMAKGRAASAAWRRSEEGRQHIQRIVQLSLAERESRAPHDVVCHQCSKAFRAKHPRAKFCSKSCALRAMRRRRTPDWQDRVLSPYATSKTGVRGVYLTKHGTWVAMIGVDRKLVYLGSFPDKAAAVAARLEGEKIHGKPSSGRRHRSDV